MAKVFLEVPHLGLPILWIDLLNGSMSLVFI